MPAAPEFHEQLQSLDSSRRAAAAAALKQRLAPCYSGNCVRSSGEDGSKDSPILRSRLGGIALLPADLPHPCDKAGRPMQLVAQLNFAEFPQSTSHPSKGVFLLFWNSLHDYSNPKDRTAFRCVWLATPEATPLLGTSSSESAGPEQILAFEEGWSLPEHASAWQDSPELYPDFAAGCLQKLRGDRQVQVMGHAGRDFASMQEIAAFAGNGVSWTPARRNDSCYSHLVDNAASWRLFLQICSVPEAGLDLGKLTMYLLIRQEDLAAARYDKCWLLLS